MGMKTTCLSKYVKAVMREYRGVETPYRLRVIDIISNLPYDVWIHASEKQDEDGTHYLMQVEVTHRHSIGVAPGWQKLVETKIEHLFYGEQAEYRYKKIVEFLKQKLWG